jgi:hypothetical protein
MRQPELPDIPPEPEPTAALHPALDLPSANVKDAPRPSPSPSPSTTVREAPSTATGVFPEASASAGVLDEVSSLDGVRAALSSGDPLGALERLSVHESRFPRGALGPEAVVLRVRALMELGQSARAESVAQDFLRKHPTSPQASRLRTIIGAGRL